jgi:DNA-directed RNA polymerase specialized sigma24 family protein
VNRIGCDHIPGTHWARDQLSREGIGNADSDTTCPVAGVDGGRVLSRCPADAHRTSPPEQGRYPTSEELEVVRLEIHDYASLRLHDSDLAEDVAQEALARCLTTIRTRGLPSNCTLGAYVTGIARHVVLDILRRGEREVPLCVADLDGRLHEALVTPPTMPDPVSGLPAAIESLSSDERFVIRRHFMEGIQCTEIARGLGVAPARIRKQKQRALQKIRVALGTGS